MKSLIILGILLLLHSSCSVKTNVIGKFSSNKGSNIELKNDSTFIYEYRAFHLYQYSVGKWEMLKKNLITLTSEIKSTVVPITVKNIGNQGSGNMLSINLKIDSNKLLSDYKCGVYVNGSLYFVKRCDSISSVAINVPINNISFHFTKEPALTTTTAITLPVFTDKYVTKTSIDNKMEIEVDFNDYIFYYRSFNGDTVQIKGRNIRMYNDYSKKWEKVLKVSEMANIFSRFNDEIQ